MYQQRLHNARPWVSWVEVPAWAQLTQINNGTTVPTGSPCAGVSPAISKPDTATVLLRDGISLAIV